MTKNAKFNSPNVIELEDLKTIYAKENYDLLEEKAKDLIKKYPNVPSLYNILGVSQSSKGSYGDAISNFERAIGMNSKFLDAHNNLGIALKNSGEFLRALNVFQGALKINSNHPLTNFNLGDLYEKFNEIDKAIGCFKKSVELKPDFNLAYSNYLFFINYSDKYEKNFYYKEAIGYSESIKKFDETLLTPFQYDSSPKNLKIGFVSGDLRKHPIGYFLHETLGYLKSMNLELIAFSNLEKNREDKLSQAFKKIFSKWHSVNTTNDLDLINLVRREKINLLVDLSGHSANSRLPIFINKPAPVQATWIGYLDTTGIKEMDYIIADPFVVDEDQENLFVEKIWKMPKIWNCFSKPDYDIQVETLPALKNKYITFGSFNHLNKLNDSVIKLWSELLKKIPKSKLFLKYKSLNDDYYKDSIKRKFNKNGIEESQLILEGSSPREDLLKTYNKIDISLDPFPYSGGTTNFESVWMGVPILTLKGKKFISRCGESVNHNLGMSDWIARDEDNFVSKASVFCSDLNKLSDLRARLRQKALNSPLFDSKKFAEDFHEALWKMWKIFLNKN